MPRRRVPAVGDTDLGLGPYVDEAEVTAAYAGDLLPIGGEAGVLGGNGRRRSGINLRHLGAVLPIHEE